MEVFLAGRVAVEADGVLIDEARFPGRQGRLLFAYLVAEQGRPVPRDELAAALWEESPPATWEKALSVIVSKLRALLADAGADDPNVLTSAFGCYRLHLPEGSWVDVIAAAEAFQVDERCRRLLADELGAYPSPETESIYRGLLNAPAIPAGADAAPAARPPDAVRPGRSRRRVVVLACGTAIAAAAIIATVV